MDKIKDIKFWIFDLDNTLYPSSTNLFSGIDICTVYLNDLGNTGYIGDSINNASIGAANLRKQAFLGASIDKQLNEAAAEFINSPRGVQIIEGKLVVSKIYDWYRDDFGGTDKDVIAHLRQFAQTSLHKALQRINNIDSYTYNWHLNSAVD